MTLRISLERASRAEQLQQFVSSSPWAVEPVRRRLSALAEEAVGPEAWVIDDTGFKKDGTASACVARQYSGTLGKVGNCQVATTVHMATDAASCPVNWRLFVPESWDDTRAETNEEVAAIEARRTKADPGECPEQAEVGARAGDDRRACPLGAHLPGRGSRCRLRRQHVLPGRPDRPLDPVGDGGQGRQHRLSGRCRPRAPCIRWRTGSPKRAALPAGRRDAP
ncbi:transposase [Pseudarthrobacter phenanthrenivorans]|uniref:Transposase n=1 Tax=Pseudarthrobacter phenanthrenivorans TaxID=361575 RepID=A0A3B0F2J5_PSEPS|nr:transposase [Pseudarthrobacter phenanthrenivorans]